MNTRGPDESPQPPEHDAGHDDAALARALTAGPRATQVIERLRAAQPELVARLTQKPKEVQRWTLWHSAEEARLLEDAGQHGKAAASPWEQAPGEGLLSLGLGGAESSVARRPGPSDGLGVLMGSARETSSALSPLELMALGTLRAQGQAAVEIARLIAGSGISCPPGGKPGLKTQQHKETSPGRWSASVINDVMAAMMGPRYRTRNSVYTLWDLSQPWKMNQRNAGSAPGFGWTVEDFNISSPAPGERTLRQAELDGLRARCEAGPQRGHWTGTWHQGLSVRAAWGPGPRGLRTVLRLSEWEGSSFASLTTLRPADQEGK